VTSQRSGLPKRRRHLPEVNEVIEVTGNRSASRGPPTSPANLRPRDRDVLQGGGAVRGAVEEAAGETHGGHPARRKLARNRGGDPGAKAPAPGDPRAAGGRDLTLLDCVGNAPKRRPCGSVLGLEAGLSLNSAPSSEDPSTHLDRATWVFPGKMVVGRDGPTGTPTFGEKKQARGDQTCRAPGKPVPLV
jgi:hypothetical protein